MKSTPENNKRIVQNTMMLYIRMMLTMVVSLYTSRVVLHTLGVEDFGIYNVVGGVVAMFSFLLASLSGATSRFITYELGLGNIANLKKVFRCAITVHYILAIIIFVLAETIGLWFVANKLVIPEHRIIAAHCVYQCSIITTIVAIISTPYNALIIAHEKMSAFAFISIIEISIKLIIIITLGYIGYDKLTLYAIFLLFLQISIRFMYSIYCKYHFSESSSSWLWDKKCSKEMLIYSCWTMNGEFAVIGYTQGLNILLNLFFGPAVNAARAIAVQVQTAVNVFFTNFLMAVQPQITKSYASKDLFYMHQLVINSSKFSFYICLLLAAPVIFNIDYILRLWLGIVPKYTSGFVCIMLLASLDEALKRPVIMAIHATGVIKKFQLIEGSILLLILPISYIALNWYNITPYYVLWIYLIIEIVTQFIRVLIVYPLVDMRVTTYFSKIIMPLSLVCVPLVVFYSFTSEMVATNIVDFICQSLLICLITALLIVVVGLSKTERNTILSIIKTRC